jgi:hypothetical protein
MLNVSVIGSFMVISKLKYVSFILFGTCSMFQIVMQLPEHRKNVFLYLCAFLQEVLCHVNENGLDPKTVGEANVFNIIYISWSQLVFQENLFLRIAKLIKHSECLTDV